MIKQKTLSWRIVKILLLLSFLLICTSILCINNMPIINEAKACPLIFITNSCITQAAGRIGVEPNLHAITDYVNKELTPGMTRDEVHKRLEEISPIYISSSSTGNTEYILLNMCDSCPLMNSLDVIAHFTPEGILIEGYVDES